MSLHFLKPTAAKILIILLVFAVAHLGMSWLTWGTTDSILPQLIYKTQNCEVKNACPTDSIEYCTGAYLDCGPEAINIDWDNFLLLLIYYPIVSLIIRRRE